MSSRKRILDGNPHGEGFSYQFPLFCGEYNQGCNGGYPELVAKWSHDITLLPESCGSYDLGDQSCKVTCDVGSVDQYRVSEYGYVGGLRRLDGGEHDAGGLRERADRHRHRAERRLHVLRAGCLRARVGALRRVD